MSDAIRASMIKYISENPCTIVVQNRPLVDNGFGIMIPDLTQAAVEETLGIGRVARRRLPEPIVTNASTPYDYQDVYYLLVAYDATWLRKGLVFAYFNKKYRTGTVEQRIMLGQVTYQLCDLEEVTSFNAEEVYA